MTRRTFYITTPIYYVNDSPHVGHAYTTIAADAVARFMRMEGYDVFFLTGLDEHGQKVYKAAQAAGLEPQVHVDRMAEPFLKLWKRLGITNDDFIRTTEDRHAKVVQMVLQDLYDRGEIYKQSSAGWYSVSEERFWMEKDLIDGKCPVSGQPVEWIEETNWFFRMSKYRTKLIEWIEQHPGFIRPESRRNEVLGYLRQDLGDLCISRPASRLPWGIPLPFAPEWVTYVWFDALLNYISAIGYGTDEARFKKYWPASYHLVGKDILTTHAVYWSTMLFALGLEPAECLFAHGWWTVEGKKMSKTLRNVVDPNLLIDIYGPDAVRYHLLREVPFGLDGDFSHRGFMVRYNADLANDFGNLVHRTLSMIENWLSGVVPRREELTDADYALERLASECIATVRKAFPKLDFQEALSAIWTLIQAGNKYIDTEQPWSLNRRGLRARLETVLRNVLETIRIVAVLLSPVCPGKCDEILKKIGASVPGNLENLSSFELLIPGTAIHAGEPAFPRITELHPRVKELLEAENSRQITTETEEKTEKEVKMDSNAQSENAPCEELITYEEFSRVKMVVGKVLEAEKHPRADRLLVLKVDLGESAPRTVVAGIAAKYSPEELVGKYVVVVRNLVPATLRGIKSEGMILAAAGDSVEALVTVSSPVTPGMRVR